ncbi:hypothetical protein HELRODRAFT_194801, partial [Helobdella robusta]|uniref:Uncharacterized protein n=1 Tax=Helobdella robusta TaxID=6412 RepID=T1FWF4_HELRO
MAVKTSSKRTLLTSPNDSMMVPNRIFPPPAKKLKRDVTNNTELSIIASDASSNVSEPEVSENFSDSGLASEYCNEGLESSLQQKPTNLQTIANDVPVVCEVSEIFSLNYGLGPNRQYNDLELTSGPIVDQSQDYLNSTNYDDPLSKSLLDSSLLNVSNLGADFLNNINIE